MIAAPAVQARDAVGLACYTVTMTTDPAPHPFTPGAEPDRCVVCGADEAASWHPGGTGYLAGIDEALADVRRRAAKRDYLADGFRRLRGYLAAARLRRAIQEADDLLDRPDEP